MGSAGQGLGPGLRRDDESCVLVASSVIPAKAGTQTYWF
jgi:hypothetical protein